MQAQQVVLHLSLLDGIGPAVINMIIEKKPTTLVWSAFYDFKIADWRAFGITQQTAEKLVVGLQDRSILEKELELIEKYQVDCITILDDRYPLLLNAIHLPPPVLYVLGAPLQERTRIAIVGSRKANQYGENAIHMIVPELVNYGFTIVSGGALGADSMAHHKTVRTGGNTIAVLGSGLCNLTPVSNRRMFESILENDGSIVSSFCMREQAFAGNFPARNRIISGLSNGTLVIQAAAKSGAAITAQYALDQGRDVYAIPGLIDDELSAGCHKLIQAGAKLVTNAHDILIEYGFEKKEEQQSIVVDQKKSFSHHPDQQIVIECARSISIDELSLKTNLSLSELQSKLFNLQLEGLIEQDFMGMWKAV